MSKIAVLIPCYNESKTVEKVITDWKRELPEADIYVYDNNSTDGTDEIAKLICSDEGVGGHYAPEELKEQLLTRLDEQFGRNYILKRDGEIIHHAATYAELDNLAVISGVITREDWRGKGVGTLAVRKLCYDLLKEGKKPCLFYYTKQAEGFYKKIGFEEGTGWAKLVLRKE